MQFPQTIIFYTSNIHRYIRECVSVVLTSFPTEAISACVSGYPRAAEGQDLDLDLDLNLKFKFKFSPKE